MKARTAPFWHQPQNVSKLPKLKLFNSLTNNKDLFIPKNGNKVEWYSCGPTVYDVSHMGHARTYISIDILRRVMQDYFKFDLHFVMNITDIDDKIIKRARQNYLFDNYLSESSSTKYLDDIKEALAKRKTQFEKELDNDKKQMYGNEVAKINEIIKKKMINKDAILALKDSISDMLDSKLGSSVTDNKIFVSLPKHFENEFHEDMKKLNILPPDELTHVSTYIDKIIAYVNKIIDNGYGYESNGSVYFDTAKFDSEDKFYYAKLVPGAYGNEVLLKEGEGVLSSSDTDEKRNPTDFALWKASKPGEPSWNSPWGGGRPGWHIECSAMATDKCGSTLDIHTGGVDLKFPHHDNELAQAEACLNCSQWCNYFLHTGHLTISGCKMSKSLKNFISIRDSLKKYSWRQLRFAFLMMSWKDTLDYSDETMTAACSLEKMFLNFFFTIKHILRVHKLNQNTGDNKVDNEMTEEFKELLDKTKTKVDEALCDSIETRFVISTLRELMTAAIGNYTTNGATNCDVEGLRQSALLIFELLRMFGAADSHDEFGLIRYTIEELTEITRALFRVGVEFAETIQKFIDQESSEYDETVSEELGKLITDYQLSKLEIGVSSNADLESLMLKVARLRQNIRVTAIKGKWKSILTECDKLRDVALPAIDIHLRDSNDSIPEFGLLPSWAIQDQLNTASKTKQPEAQKSNNTKKKPKKVEKSFPAERMFKEHGFYAGRFSAFDDTGFPTLDMEGKVLSNSQKKKLTKEREAQMKAYEKYMDNL